MVDMRRGRLYWLAVALALTALIYVVWQNATDPPARDVHDEVREKYEHTHAHEGALAGVLLTEANPPTPEEKAAMAEAEAFLNKEFAGMWDEPIESDVLGSVRWKGNAGYSKLTSLGCRPKDCTIVARDVRGGPIQVIGTMRDNQSGNFVSCLDNRYPIDAYPCFNSFDKPGRGAEWHVTVTRNDITGAGPGVSKRSFHPQGP
jgi:hypothetical protein